MTRSLEDFVIAVKDLAATRNEKLSLVRIQQMLEHMRVSKDSIESIRDDVVEELVLDGLLEKQPGRKTTRYFPRLKRFESAKEAFVYELAGRFIQEDGKRQRGIERTKNDWYFQSKRARKFLEAREKSGRLEYNVTLDEFLSAVRSRNAQKATTSRLRNKRRERRRAKKTKRPAQRTLF